MGKQKYFTEEERKQAAREWQRRYREKNLEKCRESSRNYNKNHTDKIEEYYKAHREELLKYKSEWYKNNKEEQLQKCKEYREHNREKIAANKKKYYQDNRDVFLKKSSEYNSTKEGRSKKLLRTYKRNDKNANRGECTLTAEWIVENIFSKPCHYCGESDWTKIGCDRIDNSKPHTPDNVVPCCARCNNKRGTKEYNEFIKIIKEKNT